MKLYLGSYRIADPSRLESLLGKPLERLNVAIIGNAKDLQSNNKRADLPPCGTYKKISVDLVGPQRK